MTRPLKWTEELCLEAVRCYSAETDTPTATDYEQWRKRVGDRPTERTIERMFGSWHTARLRAASDPETVVLNRRGPNMGFSEQDRLDAIRRYEEETRQKGERATIHGYMEWQKQHSDAPSSILKHGKWNELRVRAADDPENVKLDRRGSKGK